MIRTFREFVDKRENEKHFRHQLLHGVGLKDDTIRVSAIDPPQKLIDTLVNLTGDDEESIKSRLQAFQNSRLIDLVHEFGGEQSDIGTDQQQGDQIMGTPAQLPPGQPKPPKKPPQMPEMPVGNMPPMG